MDADPSEIRGRLEWAEKEPKRASVRSTGVMGAARLHGNSGNVGGPCEAGVAPLTDAIGSSACTGVGEAYSTVEAG